MNAEQIVAIAKVLIGIAILLGACRPLWMKRVDEKLNGRRPPVEHTEGPSARLVRRIWTNQVGRVVLILVAGSICVVFAARILGAIGTSSTSRASSVSSKFTSEEFGFAAKFTTSDVKEKTISPAMTSFVSYIDNGAYYSEVQVLTKDLSQDLVDDAYLDRMMETTVKAGHFVVLDKAKYATLHGYPAITQEMRLDPTSGHEASVSMMIVVAKDRNHIYMVTGLASPNSERSSIQRFLASFELKDAAKSS